MTRKTLLTLGLTVAVAAFALGACTGSGDGDRTVAGSDDGAAVADDQFLALAESQALEAVGIDAGEARDASEPRESSEALTQDSEVPDVPESADGATAIERDDGTVLYISGLDDLERGDVDLVGVIDADGTVYEIDPGTGELVITDATVTVPPPTQVAQSTLTAISTNEFGEPEYPDSQVTRTLTPQEELLTGIWTRSINAVVLINTESQPRRGFFGFQVPDDSTGAGFFWDEDGHIVTNAHVVQSGIGAAGIADEITVTTHSGIDYVAELVGADILADLAVLKIEAPSDDESHTLPLGDSATLIPGMTAIALGHPFGTGQDFSMTHGIVSGLDREIQTTGDINLLAPGIIQTDADVNPGNSGGPLLNSSGQVIGVNTQIRSLDSTNSGVGFALPINLVRRIVDGIIANGAALRSYMGISMLSIDRIMGAADIPEDLEGIYLSVVASGTPAGDAGLRGDSVYGTSSAGTLAADGDIIVGIDDTPIADINDLRQYLTFNTLPGDTVTIQIRREGEVIEIPVTLASRSDFE